MRYFYLVSVSCFLLFQMACNGSTNSKNEKLREEIMAYHDEAMPQLTTIKRIGTKLYQVTELPIFKTWPIERQNELNQLLNQLGDAEKGMWNWMYAYHAPEEYPEGLDVPAYLAEEKVKAKVMRDKIFVSIDAATKFMEQYGIK